MLNFLFISLQLDPQLVIFMLKGYLKERYLFSFCTRAYINLYFRCSDPPLWGEGSWWLEEKSNLFG